MRPEKRLLVFIPTYNELGNVAELCSRIMALNIELDMLFLDDNSPDGTGDLLDRLAGQHSTIHVIHRPEKLGIGSAHFEGIAWAYDRQYETLITMDGDFTHPPENVPDLLRMSRDADVVVGSRYLLKNSLDEWTVFRKFLTSGGHFLTKHLLKLPYDASTAYRLYRLNRIPRGVFHLVRSQGYAFFFESLFALHANGFSIKEVGIILPARACGQSKMTVREACRGLSRLAQVSLSTMTNSQRYRLRELSGPGIDGAVTKK